MRKIRDVFRTNVEIFKKNFSENLEDTQKKIL